MVKIKGIKAKRDIMGEDSVKRISADYVYDYEMINDHYIVIKDDTGEYYIVNFKNINKDFEIIGHKVNRILVEEVIILILALTLGIIVGGWYEKITHVENHPFMESAIGYENKQTIIN